MYLNLQLGKNIKWPLSPGLGKTDGGRSEPIKDGVLATTHGKRGGSQRDSECWHPSTFSSGKTKWSWE